MLRTNKTNLPILLVQGEVLHPPGFSQNVGVSPDGKTFILPNIGGITYNAKIGDLCTGWAADHLEPGVTTRNSNDGFNDAYTTFSCIGNTAIVASGDAKGKKGFVTGKHGGCEHLICYFDDETMDKMTIGDRIDVRSCGQGMELLDYPDILLRNMSPKLLEKMNIKENGKHLNIGVAKIVPAIIIGSGIGNNPTQSGDYDIILHDKKITAKYGLHELRFGDIVALINADTRYGRSYLTGAVTIGVVIHGGSNLAGHGPGVTTLLTCKTRLIEPFIDPKANLADMLL